MSSCCVHNDLLKHSFSCQKGCSWHTYHQAGPWSRREPRRTFPNAPGSWSTAAPTVTCKTPQQPPRKIKHKVGINTTVTVQHKAPSSNSICLFMISWDNAFRQPASSSSSSSRGHTTDLSFGFNLLFLDHFLHHAFSQRQEHSLGEFFVLCWDGLSSKPCSGHVIHQNESPSAMWPSVAVPASPDSWQTRSSTDSWGQFYTRPCLPVKGEDAVVNILFIIQIMCPSF